MFCLFFSQFEKPRKKGRSIKYSWLSNFDPKKYHEIQLLTQCACGQIWPKRRRKIQMLPNVTKSDQKHSEILFNPVWPILTQKTPQNSYLTHCGKFWAQKKPRNSNSNQCGQIWPKKRSEIKLHPMWPNYLWKIWPSKNAWQSGDSFKIEEQKKNYWPKRCWNPWPQKNNDPK